jgi:tetratricopeptide (TPR) repeat protein
MAEAEQPQPLPLRVFLASPGDVHEERERARRLLKHELPYDVFLGDCFTFRVVSWDDPDARMPMPAGMTPQGAVIRFGPKPSACDIVVVVLWSRLGTHLDLSAFGERPGGGAYLSGTEWEFEDAWGAKPRPEILVYRRTEVPTAELSDPNWQEKVLQYQRVSQFMERFKNPDMSLRGGWTDYKTPADFGERLASDLRRLLRERVEVTRVAAEKGVPLASLRAVRARFGEYDELPESEIPARLARWAEAFTAARELLERATNDRPEAEAARHHAAELLAANDLEAAQAVLARARQSLRESRQQTAQEEAAILADEARVHRLRLDYPAAADALLEAAALVTSFDRVQAWRHKLEAGGALIDRGQEFADKDALVRAIAICRDALALAPRAARPDAWAATQNNLGKALRLLGEREAGTARLEEAVATFRATLEVHTRERVPLAWAMTQNSLGEALRLLGEREAGTARLEEAVKAFQLALEERIRERVPFDWAWAQSRLGVALTALGKREAGMARLEEAVAVCRLAVEERTRQREPLQWARTQSNLGKALQALGEREAGTARLEEAVEVFRLALEEWTRERVPPNWAETQTKLGNTLRMLGEREASTARLEEAVEVFRLAMAEQTRERAPLQWAETQANLGAALAALGEREAGTARLEEAVEVFRLALGEWTCERAPLQWAETQTNLGRAVAEMGTRNGDPARWQEALTLLEGALGVFEAAGATHDGAKTREYRDALLATLAETAHS